MENKKRLVITGAAGLVGQNLIVRLKRLGFRDIAGIDCHPANTRTLKRLHPDLEVIFADLAEHGEWEKAVAGADTLVICHAQIGGQHPVLFRKNNIQATENLLDVAVTNNIDHIVHVSSSVVESIAVDDYAVTKEKQEKLVLNCGLPACAFRPTLMFGWFDRKHIGWLSHFIRRTPVFPIPGDGKYIRQPLYAGDFCNILISSIQDRRAGEVFNISGLEKIYYVDLVKTLKSATGAHAAIVRIPYRLFWYLLKIYGVFDRDPPFTTSQLEALVLPEEFEIIDWPQIFKVTPTPLTVAFQETFRHPEYSKITLEF